MLAIRLDILDILSGGKYVQYAANCPTLSLADIVRRLIGVNPGG